MRSLCPKLYGRAPRTDSHGPDHPDTPKESREKPVVQARNRPVNAVEMVARSSALEGMKVWKAAGPPVVASTDLEEFISQVGEDDSSEDIDADDTDGDGEPVMAGERARRFSELSPEFDEEEGRAA